MFDVSHVIPPVIEQPILPATTMQASFTGTYADDFMEEYLSDCDRNSSAILEGIEHVSNYTKSNQYLILLKTDPLYWPMLILMAIGKLMLVHMISLLLKSCQ